MCGDRARWVHKPDLTGDVFGKRGGSGHENIRTCRYRRPDKGHRWLQMTVTSGEGKQHPAGRRLHDQRLSTSGPLSQDDVAIAGSGPLAGVDQQNPDSTK